MNKEEINLQYNSIGHHYIEGQKAFYSKRNDWTRSFVASHMGNISGKRVLDIGCGGGFDLQSFEEQGAKPFGIDPSEIMVKASQKLIGPENVRLGDYEHIPFPDHSFDVVFGRFSLHYLKDLDKAYKEIRRVLVSGGDLFQVVSHPSFDLAYLMEPGHEHNELITVHLYNDERVLISFPPHNFRDYFSACFFKLFTLQAVDEKVDEVPGKPTAPGSLSYWAKAN